jgi:Asp/Glu/hydantoin racemase
MKRVVLLHTVMPLVAVFDRLAKEMLPGVQVFHVLDEPCLEKIRLHNLNIQTDIDLEDRFNREIAAQLMLHISTALEIQADALLVTCSTASPYVDLISTALPVVRIDEAMIAQAVVQAKRVGVLATNPTTLQPTRLSLENRAGQEGKRLEVQVKLVEGAFSALMSGDAFSHDRLLIQAIRKMAQETDLIILAQASMARVVDVLPEDIDRTAILTSPHTALMRVKQILEG